MTEQGTAEGPPWPRWWGRKLVRLPDHGVLLVATDLQGNLGDFHALVAAHRREREAGRAAWLLLCGDMVHGPPAAMNDACWPDYLGAPYADRSAELVLALMDYVRNHDAVCLLGNHEHAHVGGPRVSKFHDDEAEVLERALGERCAAVREFLAGLPLVAAAPCGIVCTHGAPRATEPDDAAFERLRYDGFDHLALSHMIDAGTVGALLWARGATEAQAEALLAVVHGHAEFGFVAYGHDIVREGYECLGRRQICVSTSFGCHDADKTYLRLELDRRYEDVGALRVGHEILPLYPERR